MFVGCVALLLLRNLKVVEKMLKFNDFMSGLFLNFSSEATLNKNIYNDSSFCAFMAIKHLLSESILYC